MRKQFLILCAAVLLMSWNVAYAADEGGAFVAGESSVGAHYANVTDNPQRVGEYVNLADTETLMADMYLDLFGGTSNALYNVGFTFHDTSTKSFSFGVDTHSLVSADFSYGSFVHNLDHDLLINMQGREGVPDPNNASGLMDENGLKPGGKQVYHTDLDPLGRYYLEYEKFQGNVSVDLPFLAEGKLVLGYTDLHKTGYKQSMTIDHCAFCHVESQSQRIDRQTQTWAAGVQGTQGSVSMKYDFIKQDYVDHAGAPSHHWKSAVHPVNGSAGGEFDSRHLFTDVTLPYARSADTEKISHSAAAKVDLKQNGTVKGSYTYTKNRNWWTGVENKFNAGALGYAVRLNRDLRLTAKFLSYETKVDDYFVDMPNFRAYDTTNGNLNFDWNRISSANRTVNQADLNLGWRVAKGRHLRLNWRIQSIDRPAMAQSQTSYLFDGVNSGEAGATLVPSTAYANKTTLNRIKLRYDARLGMKGRYNLTYTYTNVDKPYMNPTAMCEESLLGTNSAHISGGAAGRIYYFQRQRYGMGSSMPSQSQKLLLKGSYQLSSRTAVNAFLAYSNDKNEDLNIYQFERDVLAPGINVWTAPNDRVLFTLGWSMNKVKSNANMCVPIFDG